MIRNVLWEYYHPDERDIKKTKEKGVYVFDACSLLEIYKLPTDKRKSLFTALDSLSKKDQLWLPYQFATEYLKGRKNVLREELNKYDETVSQLKNLGQTIVTSTSKYNFNLLNHILIDIEQVKSKLINHVNKSIELGVLDLAKKKAKHPDWMIISNDVIHKKIDKLFKIGSCYTAAELVNIKEVVKMRLKDGIKPGVTDQSKGINDAGDVLAWLQMLEHAKKSKKPMVLITEETKNDWYEKWSNESARMPARSLAKEMHVFSKQLFFVMSLREFMGDTDVAQIDIQRNLEVAVTSSNVAGSEEPEPLTNETSVVSK